jgi:flagellar hook-associated protein 2
VTATATADATNGSLAFTVEKLATTHAIVTGKNWTSADQAFGLGSPLTLTKSDNSTVTITPTDTNSDGTISLGEAVSAINAANAGVGATAVNTGSGYLPTRSPCSGRGRTPRSRSAARAATG